MTTFVFDRLLCTSTIAVQIFVLSLVHATLGIVGPDPALAQSCATIGDSVHCGTSGAQNRVGRTVIFNQGPTGKTLGDFLEIEGEDGRTRIDGELPAAPAPRARPQTNAPGSFIDLKRGRDFGAFEFPIRRSLSPLGGGGAALRPSGPN